MEKNIKNIIDEALNNRNMILSWANDILSSWEKNDRTSIKQLSNEINSIIKDVILVKNKNYTIKQKYYSLVLIYNLMMKTTSKILSEIIAEPKALFDEIIKIITPSIKNYKTTNGKNIFKLNKNLDIKDKDGKYSNLFFNLSITCIRDWSSKYSFNDSNKDQSKYLKTISKLKKDLEKINIKEYDSVNSFLTEDVEDIQDSETYPGFNKLNDIVKLRKEVYLGFNKKNKNDLNTKIQNYIQKVNLIELKKNNQYFSQLKKEKKLVAFLNNLLNDISSKFNIKKIDSEDDANVIKEYFKKEYNNIFTEVSEDSKKRSINEKLIKNVNITKDFNRDSIKRSITDTDSKNIKSKHKKVMFKKEEIEKISKSSFSKFEENIDNYKFQKKNYNLFDENKIDKNLFKSVFENNDSWKIVGNKDLSRITNSIFNNSQKNKLIKKDSINNIKFKIGGKIINGLSNINNKKVQNDLNYNNNKNEKKEKTNPFNISKNSSKNKVFSEFFDIDKKNIVDSKKESEFEKEVNFDEFESANSNFKSVEELGFDDFPDDNSINNMSIKNEDLNNTSNKKDISNNLNTNKIITSNIFSKNFDKENTSKNPFDSSNINDKNSIKNDENNNANIFDSKLITHDFKQENNKNLKRSNSQKFLVNKPVNIKNEQKPNKKLDNLNIKYQNLAEISNQRYHDIIVLNNEKDKINKMKNMLEKKTEILEEEIKKNNKINKDLNNKIKQWKQVSSNNEKKFKDILAKNNKKMKDFYEKEIMFFKEKKTNFLNISKDNLDVDANNNEFLKLLEENDKLKFDINLLQKQQDTFKQQETLLETKISQINGLNDEILNLRKTIMEKSNENKNVLDNNYNLNFEKKELLNKHHYEKSEKHLLITEIQNLKAKIEEISNEKKDLQKKLLSHDDNNSINTNFIEDANKKNNLLEMEILKFKNLNQTLNEENIKLKFNNSNDLLKKSNIIWESQNQKLNEINNNYYKEILNLKSKIEKIELKNEKVIEIQSQLDLIKNLKNELIGQRKHINHISNTDYNQNVATNNISNSNMEGINLIKYNEHILNNIYKENEFIEFIKQSQNKNKIVEYIYKDDKINANNYKNSIFSNLSVLFINDEISLNLKKNIKKWNNSEFEISFYFNISNNSSDCIEISNFKLNQNFKIIVISPEKLILNSKESDTFLVRFKLKFSYKRNLEPLILFFDIKTMTDNYFNIYNMNILLPLFYNLTNVYNEIKKENWDVLKSKLKNLYKFNFMIDENIIFEFIKTNFVNYLKIDNNIILDINNYFGNYFVNFNIKSKEINFYGFNLNKGINEMIDLFKYIFNN